MNRGRYIYDTRTFEGGLDFDTDIRRIEPNRMRDCVNFEVISDGNATILCQIRGVETKFSVEADVSNGFNVLGMFYAKCRADINCTGDFITQDCLVIFTYDNTNLSRIHLYNIAGDYVYQLWPDPNNPNNFLDFPADGAVDGFYYQIGDRHWFYWVDDKNYYRSIELVVYGEDCNDDAYFHPKFLSARPVFSRDKLDLREVKPGGALLSGSYSFFYRYYSSTRCKFSAWSAPINPIPVVPDKLSFRPGAMSVIWGGLPGEPTDKAIVLELQDFGDSEGYDMVQIGILPYNDGSREVPTTFTLLQPSKEFFEDKDNIVINGQESGITRTVEEFAVEDLPVIRFKSVGEQDGIAFAANYKLRNWDMDRGDPDEEISADNILQQVDYRRPEDVYRYTSHWRGENYAYGITYVDELGNWSTVKPIDLSEIDGQESWSWQFPERSNRQFSILNEQSRPEALGIRLSNIKNHPSWARGFQIVRLERKKDVLYQTVHIPTVAVQGANTWGVYPVDYDGRFDHVAPKVHKMGTARNLHRESVDFRVMAFGNDVEPELIRNMPISTFSYPQYQVHASAIPGLEIRKSQEIPKTIWAMPPEYMFNWQGNPYSLDLPDGGVIKIEDAVLLRQTRVYTGDSEFTRPVGALKTEDVTLFRALDHGQYTYCRNGWIDIGGFQFQGLITDVGLVIDAGILLTTETDYAIPLTYAHTFQALPYTPFKDDDFAEISTFFNAQQLVRNQGESDAILFRDMENFPLETIGMRGMIIATKKPLPDFTYLAHYARELNINFFPLVDWDYEPNNLNDNWLNNSVDEGELEFNLRLRFANDLLGLGAVNRTNSVPSLGSSTNPIAPAAPILTKDIEAPYSNAAFILNVRTGVGSNRYGEIDNVLGDWQSTGVYVPLSQEDVVANIPKTVDVFGGDCFINFVSLKVHDSHHRTCVLDIQGANLLDYRVDGQDDVAFITLTNERWRYRSSTIAKTGMYKKSIEMMELWLESGVNADLRTLRQHYPNQPEGGGLDSLSLYDRKYPYDYNFGYSAKNAVKLYFSNSKICGDKMFFPHGAVYSDRNVRGLLSTDFESTEGLNRFRVNNRLDLDTKHGQITKSVLLNNNVWYLIQEDRVYSQPIFVAEIRTQDGNIISTGTSEAIASKGDYFAKPGGSQHLKSISIGMGRCWFVDVRMKKPFYFGPHTGLHDLSAKQAESYFNEVLHSGITERDLVGAANSKEGYYIISHPEFSIRFNRKLDAWETRLEFANGFYIHGQAMNAEQEFWIAPGEKGQVFTIFEAYRGDLPGFLPGGLANSEVLVPSNLPGGIEKTFDEIIIDGTNPLTSVDILVPVMDTDNQPEQFTADINLLRKPRTSKYYQNVLRWKDSAGRSSRFRGKAMLAKMKLVNGILRPTRTTKIVMVTFLVRESAKNF